MNKELEKAYNSIESELYDSDLHYQKCSKSLDIVYNAIQRLGQIENANPSEALERLDKMGKEEIVVRSRDTIYMNGNTTPPFVHLTTVGVNFKGTIETIKQALLKSQEQEKALKILFEKNVDIIRIKHLIFKSQKNPKYWDLRYYNEVRVIDDEKLTQEEFELLKRYFG